MAACLIIGGGFAGLSTAVYLTKYGHKVHLIEASPKLGGRAYSFSYSPQNDTIDNGQHIMMGCYDYFLDFINLIGTIEKLDLQDKLNINFVERGGRIFEFSASSKLYPFNLINAVLRYSALSFKDRLRIFKVITNLLFGNSPKLKSLTANQWLMKNWQNDKTIKSLWEIIVVSTLNTSLENASAYTFARILREIFFNGNSASTVIIPNTDLNDLYCEKAKNFILAGGGKVSLSEEVIDFIENENSISKITTSKGVYDDFEYIISAIPHYSLIKLCKVNSIFPSSQFGFEYSPIVNVHLWLKTNPFDQKFYGLMDSKIHWIFNHKKHVTLTTSYANDFVNLDSKKILDFVCAELEIYFPVFYKDLVIDYKIIKEKKATFIPTNNTERMRSTIKSPYNNLVLAGDWTGTELPSTIESAVKSGKKAADRVQSLLS